MLGLLAALLGFLGWQAFLSPAIEFLPPAWRGTWIVHPHPPVPFRTGDGGLAARFTHRFSLAAVPRQSAVRVTALESFRVTLNGTALAVPAPANWKRPAAVELAGALRAGDNEFVIEVRNPRGPPALLVQGPAWLRTGTNWTVALGPAFGADQPAAAAGAGESYRQGRPHPLRGTRAWPWCVAGAVVWLGFLAWAVIPRGSRLGGSPIDTLRAWRLALPTDCTQPVEPGGRGSRRAETIAPRWWRQHGASLLIVLAAGIVHLHNARAYPHARSPFDVGGHLEYIRQVARAWRAPTARDGWEMYQPPLYYFAAAGVYRLAGGPSAEPRSLKAVQSFSAAAGFAGLLAAWWLLAVLFPDRPQSRQLGLAAVAMLPMALYMNPMITNEVFAATVIALALALAVRWLRGATARPADPSPWVNRKKAQKARCPCRPACAFCAFLRQVRLALLVGLACGLALLAKFTGLFVGVAVLLALLRRAARDRRRLGQLAVFAATLLLVAGWFYVRNARLYGDPFTGNWDAASGQQYEQHPGYRTLADYTRFGRVLAAGPAGSAFQGFWNGLYGSAWSDGHGSFLRWDNPGRVIAAMAILWLALLPMAAMLLGFARTVRRLWRGEDGGPWLVLVLVSVFTGTALISFTMELPFFSTVKGFFLLSLAAPAGAFAARGFEAMADRLGRARWLIHLSLAVLAALITWQYWYRGT